MRRLPFHVTMWVSDDAKNVCPENAQELEQTSVKEDSKRKSMALGN